MIASTFGIVAQWRPSMEQALVVHLARSRYGDLIKSTRTCDSQADLWDIDATVSEMSKLLRAFNPMNARLDFFVESLSTTRSDQFPLIT